MPLRYGCADAERRIRELRCIWISHMHADHHGGLYRLLELRTQLLGPDVTPILVIGPPPLFRVLRLYQEVVLRLYREMVGAAPVPGGGRFSEWALAS
eukprot:657688-Pelagomonas_calceolata.AAC.4